ncbi:suppressor protein Stm1p [Monosporozyma unispora]|nr:hypothetical protein C6P44_004883 [Kazachstania unispora]
MSNPFDLLGNDVEDPNQVVVPPKEIVKSTTSSKKQDVPPPSANPARANKNRSKPSGNEGAIRNKDNGRRNNRSKNVSDSAAGKRDNTRKQTDRHSRSGKSDSGKKVRQGWGDDKKELDAEEAAKADADAEIEADAEEVSNGVKQVSLADYLKSSDNASTLNKTVEAKPVEQIEGTELFVKEQEEFVPATKVKTLKSKQLKTKKFLDFDATFQDAQKPKRSFDRKNDNRNNNRRGGNKGPRKPNAKSTNGNAVQKDNSIDTKNLPSLA